MHSTSKPPQKAVSKSLAACARLLRHGQSGGQGGHGGVGEQTVDAVRRLRQLCVVEVVGVTGDAVGQGGQLRRGGQAVADY